MAYPELAAPPAEEAPELAALAPELAPLAAEPVAPATPPTPKMVVMPVVVVNEEPDAETRAVRAEVVIALLDSVPLPPAPAPETVEVTVAVDDAPEPEPLAVEVTVAVDAAPEPLPLPVAPARTETALPVTDEPLAVEEY